MNTFGLLFNNFPHRLKANCAFLFHQGGSISNNNHQKKNPAANTVLPWIMVACAMALMLIWPIIHTIALRIILLFTGGMTAAWYVISERFSLYQKPALPLLIIFLLFVWIGIHYLFLAHNPKLELGQITGIWLRALLACLLGVGTGLFARHHRRAQGLLWVGLSVFVIIFFINYTWVGFTYNTWAIPYQNVYGLYGNKTNVAFYGIVLLALSCGTISFELMQAPRSNTRNVLASKFIIGLTFLAFVFVGTKNGVAVGLILILTLFGVYFFKANKSFRTNLLAMFFIGTIGLMSYLHLKLTPEWHNFSPTVAAGMQIDKYPQWQDVRTYGLPVLGDGSVVTESAYLRTAFATKGFHLLLDNPLGYGVVNESFKYLMKADLPDIPGVYPINVTHSGWLDFSLCLGVPGIILVWSSIALAFYFSYGQKSQWAYCSRWILAGSFLVWIVAEVGHTHFVETLFYLIALITAGNLPVMADGRNKASNSVNTART